MHIRFLQQFVTSCDSSLPHQLCETNQSPSKPVLEGYNNFSNTAYVTLCLQDSLQPYYILQGIKAKIEKYCTRCYIANTEITSVDITSVFFTHTGLLQSNNQASDFFSKNHGFRVRCILQQFFRHLTWYAKTKKRKKEQPEIQMSFL